MHILGYYDDSTGHSGTTRYLLELLSTIDRTKYRPVVFSPRPFSWHEQCRELDALVVTGPAPATVPWTSASQDSADVKQPVPWSELSPIVRARRSLALLRGTQAELKTLKSLFRTHPVDLLHSNNVGEEIAPVAARHSGVPIVVGTLHINPNFDLFRTRTGWAHRWITRRSFAALDLAIAVSERTRDDWQATMTPCPPFRVIHNGIRADRLSRRRSTEEAKRMIGVAPDALVLGSLGRLDWAKGYGDLIAALPMILKAVPGAMFVHAGRGPLAESLKAQAEAAGVGNAIRWLGFREDVRDVLEASDLYVQPSWCEAHTLSVLEAGAMDLPVVASDVGGHLETLSTDLGGWVVPAKQPERLAEAVVDALHNTHERVRRGKWLGQRVHGYFTNERMVGETLAAYEALFAARTRAG